MTNEQYKKWEEKRKSADAASELRETWKKSLEGDLHNELKYIDSSHYWEKQESIIDSSGQQSVDVRGIPIIESGAIIYIELEASRTSCVHNVIKEWMNIAENERTKPVILIHIFSPLFKSGYKKYLRAKAESVFIGEKAQNDTNEKLKYKYIQLDEWLSKEKVAHLIISEMKK